jgi:hypothetical protein
MVRANEHHHISIRVSRHSTRFFILSRLGPLYPKNSLAFKLIPARSSLSLRFLPTMSFNATVVGSHNDFTAFQLYASLNVDYSQINWFERQWMAWYLWIGNPVIATGLASLILHEVCLVDSISRKTLTRLVDRLFRSLHTMDHH